MSKLNPFIVIEALDAGGSQTQTDLLVARLKKEGFIPHQYHFPQEDTATGRLIYDKFLLYKNKQPFSRREQALLFIQDFFSRAQEMRDVQNKVGKHVVVSDRYASSTMACQTIGLTGKTRHKLLTWMNWLCSEGQPVLPKPTVVIFLDTPVEESLKHLKNKQKDFFETRTKLKAIRASYVRLAGEQKWQVIESMGGNGLRKTRQEVHAEIWAKVEPLLAKGVR